MKRFASTFFYKLFLWGILSGFALHISGQTPPESSVAKADSVRSLVVSTKMAHKSVAAYLISASLLTYGALAVAVPDINAGNTRSPYTLSKAARWGDALMEFSPGLMAVGLRLSGVEGAHRWQDQALLFSSTLLLSTAVSEGLKYIVREERPDRSNRLSFPSGHTTRAFALAEFLRREYGQVSPWITVAGYGCAIGTAALRVAHHQHWLGDVAAGAGIGIASTTLVYGLFSRWQRKHSSSTALVVPYYEPRNMGLVAVWRF